MSKLVLTYLGEDFLGMPVYKDAEGVLLKDVNCGHGEPELHTISGDDVDGDPNVHISKVKKYQGLEIVIIGNENKLSHEVEFSYNMLGRLKMDCDYFLGNGNLYEKHLWAGNVKEQIEEMKKIYNRISDDAKPKFLTYDDILEYEKRMTA